MRIPARFGLLLVILAALSLPGPAECAIRNYQITMLAPLQADMASCAWAVNNRGQAVGISYTLGGDYNRQAIFWDNGAATGLTSPPGFSYAYAINDSGVIAGSYEEFLTEPNSTGPTRACIWRDGILVDIGPDGEGRLSTAHGINSSGEVVGDEYGSSGTRFFVWHNGSRRYSTTAVGSAGGNAINDLGQVVGVADFPTTQGAFLWEGDTMSELGSPYDLGDWFSVAFDINNHWQAVGMSGLGDTHALLWQDGHITNLGSFGGRFSEALAINDLGQIVGKSGGVDNRPRAFLWEEDSLFDLNQLIPHDSGWVLSEARDINDLGQIVGMGLMNGQERAFLMTPVPEPWSLLTLGLGVIGLCLRARGSRHE